MHINSDDVLAKLPEDRQQAIQKRAAELIAEEATLRQVREAQETIEAVREGLASIDTGDGKPMDEVFDALENKRGAKARQ
jgi:TRAP-type C4-dicarboxylate transport system substrate-binding protein